MLQWHPVMHAAQTRTYQERAANSGSKLGQGSRTSTRTPPADCCTLRLHACSMHSHLPMLPDPKFCLKRSRATRSRAAETLVAKASRENSLDVMRCMFGQVYIINDPYDEFRTRAGGGGARPVWLRSMAPVERLVMVHTGRFTFVCRSARVSPLPDGVQAPPRRPAVRFPCVSPLYTFRRSLIQVSGVREASRRSTGFG
eukprot:363953-Chlamydomonas_euryale.AAC.5